MCPRGPAFEPQYRPNPAIGGPIGGKIRFEKIARANYFGSQKFKPEGTGDPIGSEGDRSLVYRSLVCEAFLFFLVLSFPFLFAGHSHAGAPQKNNRFQ